jgi:tRNA(His) guanylyltransferase
MDRDKMKSYEDSYTAFIPNNSFVVIRLDGRSFSTYTQDCVKPYDPNISNCMDKVTLALCQEIEGVILGYTQSDEISILFTNTPGNPLWMKGSINKILSITASIASTVFTTNNSNKAAQFDSRVFIVPTKEEACNYFIYRQLDAHRNCINSLARQYYNQPQLQGVKVSKLLELIAAKGVPYQSIDRGFLLGKTATKSESSQFSEYLNDHIVKQKWSIANSNDWLINKQQLVELLSSYSPV